MTRRARRDILKAAAMGSIGLGLSAEFSALSRFLLNDRLAKHLPAGALERLKDALGDGASLFHSSEALAQSTPTAAFLDIFMAMSSDIRHYVNTSDFSRANDIFQTMRSFGRTAETLGDMTKTHPDFVASRVTKWFADLVMNGSAPGATNIFGNNASVGGLQVNKPIESSRLSFLSFVSYDGTGIHRQGAIPNAGSMAYIADEAFKMSPNGVGVLGDKLELINESGNTQSLSVNVQDFLKNLDQFLQTSYYHRSPEKSQNLILQLEETVSSSEARKMRSQWLEGLENMKARIQSWADYGQLAQREFNPFALASAPDMGGNITCSRAAAMALAGAMAADRLVTVSSVGLDSFDFHSDNVDRSPQRRSDGTEIGNMMTCAVEAGVGLNAWANRLIEAGMDGVAFLRTCSGRSADWVLDSRTVSGVAIVVKGRSNGPLEDVQSAYYGPNPDSFGEGAGFVESATRDWDSGTLKLSGGKVQAASVEGAVLALIGKALGKSFNKDLGADIGVIG